MKNIQTVSIGGGSGGFTKYIFISPFSLRRSALCLRGCWPCFDYAIYAQSPRSCSRRLWPHTLQRLCWLISPYFSSLLKRSTVEPFFHLVRCETSLQQTVDHFIGISKSCSNGFQYTNALTLRLWVMVCKREAVAAPMVAVKRRPHQRCYG